MPSKPSREPLWRELPRLVGGSLERNGHTAVVVGDIIFIAGGFKKTAEEDVDCKDLLRFNILSDSWETSQLLPPSFEGFRYHTATVVDGVIWYLGGYSVDRESQTVSEPQSVHSYNVASDRWTEHTLRSTQLTRNAHASAISPLRGTQIYINGGMSHELGSKLVPMIVFDTVRVEIVELETISLHNVLDITRSHATLTPIGDYLLLLGGRYTTNKGLVDKSASCQVFCPRRSAWLASYPLLPNGRSGHSAVSLDGKEVIVFGGNVTIRDGVSNLTIITLNAATKAPIVKELPSSKYAPQGRHSPATVIVDETLYCFGGRGDNSYPGDAWAAILNLPKSGRSKPASGRGQSKTNGQARGRASKKTGQQREDAEEVPTQNGQWKTRKRKKMPMAPIQDNRLDWISDSDDPMDVPARKAGRTISVAEDVSDDRLRKEMTAALNQVKADKIQHQAVMRDLTESHQRTIVELRNSLQSAQDQLRDKKKEAEEVQRGFGHEKQRLEAELTAASDKLASEFRAYSERTSVLEKDLKQSRELIQATETRCQGLLRELGTVKASACHHETQLHTAQAEVLRLTEAVTEAAGNHADRERKLLEESQQKDQEVKNLTTKVQTLATKIHDCEAKLSRARDAHDKMLDERGVLQREITQLTTSHAQAMQEKTHQVSTEKQRALQLQQDADSARSEVEDLKQKTVALDREKERAKRMVSDLQNQMQNLQDQKLKVQSERDSYRKFAQDALKQTLESGHNLKRRAAAEFSEDPLF